MLPRFLSSEEKKVFLLVPQKHGWIIDAEYFLNSEEEFYKALPFIRKSYEGVKNRN